MQQRTLLVFAVVTALAIAGAIAISQWRAPQKSIEKELLLPDLKSRVNEVSAIRIVGKDKQVTLARSGESWTIGDADGYPALFERVKQVVVGASELRVLAEKTSNPKLFPRLDVEDPAEKGSNSVQVTFVDASDKPIADLIAGKAKRRGGPGSKAGLYVRRPGTDRALLVEGELDVPVELSAWLNRDLFDIPADRVREVVVLAADGTTATLARKLPGDELALAKVPRGKEPQSEIMLGRMATVLEAVFIDGARAADKVTLPEAVSHITVRTFDGLVAEVVSAKVDGQSLSRFLFSFDEKAAAEHAAREAAATKEQPADPGDAPVVEETGAADAGTGESAAGEEPAKPDVAGEVQKLNEAVTGWLFVIPEFKFELFTQSPAGLVRDPAKKDAVTPALE